MPAPNRRGPKARRTPPRTYDRTASDAPSGDHANPTSNITTAVKRTQTQGVLAGEVLESVVVDVHRMAKETNFRGAVDVQIELHNAKLDQNGFLVSLIGGADPKSSSISVKLATRIDLSEQNKEDKQA